MKIAIGQINTTIGDFKGNLAKIKDYSIRARKMGAELVIFPELALCGYPPKDFLIDTDFLNENFSEFRSLVKFTKRLKCAVLTGFIARNPSGIGKPIFNSAALIAQGKILFTQNKSLLPTYDVFDEGRYFEPSKGVEVFVYKGLKLGISICEDIWNDEGFWKTRIYGFDPIEKLTGLGAQILINMSSSPYYSGKVALKERMLANIAKKYRLPVIYVNLVGGNDDLIFEGRSLFLNKDGKTCLECKVFEEDLKVIDSEKVQRIRQSSKCPEEEEILNALVLGTKDYVKKCGFKDVVIGLSGGLDSALVTYIATKALGKARVHTVNMPSRYSSRASMQDSAKLAENLGVKYSLIPIDDIVRSYESRFKEMFKGLAPDTTEENIQARIRANILMAISNKFGKLVLSCGNKSELAVGYCTLYGDLSGGLAVISDLPKTTVYRLAKYINRKREIIPSNIIRKAPSAELKPDQVDQDTLPPYDKLDKILKLYIETGLDLPKIAKSVKDPWLTREILNKILLNEYKRNQAPPGLKVTTKAFGYGRRFPIAHKFRF